MALHARLGDLRGVKTWRLQEIASRPALARWFAALPELLQAQPADGRP